MRSKLAGNTAAGVFVYLLIFQFRVFVAFWSPILDPLDPSTNITALACVVSPIVIGILVGSVVYRLFKFLD